MVSEIPAEDIKCEGRGISAGTGAQTDTAFTVEHDRDVSFLVDKADVDETNATASICHFLLL